MRTTETGYDRLIELGDMTSWRTTRSRPRSPSGTCRCSGAAVGLVAGWKGHTTDQYGVRPADQPRIGHPFPVFGSYLLPRPVRPPADHRRQHYGAPGGRAGRDFSGRQLTLGVPYVFKLRTQTNATGGSRFSLRCGGSGRTRACGMDLQVDGDRSQGAVVLAAPMAATPASGGYRHGVVRLPRMRARAAEPEQRRSGPERPAVAFVCQPVTTLLPIRDSVTMVTRQLAVGLGPRADVVLCGSGGERSTSIENVDGIDHVLVPPGLTWRCTAWRAQSGGASGKVQRCAGRFSSRGRTIFRMRYGWVTKCDEGVALSCTFQSFSHFIPVIRALNPHAMLVLHMHCEWLSQLDPAIIGPRLQKVDLIVSCSDHVTALVRESFPALAERCITVHNGVFAGPEPDPEPATPRRLLFVSRVSPEKGVHVLLDAFRSIAATHPDVTLAIVGPEHTIPAAYIVDLAADPALDGLKAFYDGTSYGDALRRRIPPELADRVSFLGFVAPEKLIDHYRTSTLLVHPSLSDSFGMPVVEAMASGLPVVATEVGGIPEIVQHGTTGLLVPPNDSKALATAVQLLLDDHELAMQMGRMGRRRAREVFSWEKAAATLWSAYENVSSRP